MFDDAGLTLIEESFRAVAEKMNFQILEFNEETNHVHALIEYPPKLSISQIANSVKGVSSRRYGQAGYQKPRNKEVLWSPSYFADSADSKRSIQKFKWRGYCRAIATFDITLPLQPR